jgi:hypothetical protein
MGIQRKTVAYRTDEETRLRHERIRSAIPWLLEDHTSVIKFCARIVYVLLFTSVTVHDVRELLQGLRRVASLCDADSAQYTLPFPGSAAGLRVRL